MEEIQLPEVFPSVNELSDALNNAFTERLITEVRKLVCEPVEALNIDEDLLLNSVLHHKVTPSLYRPLLDPGNSLLQIVGVFLNEGTLLNKLIGEPSNSIINKSSMNAARLKLLNIDNVAVLSLVHRCKYKPSLDRYLSSSDGVSVEVEDDTAIITWSISLGSEEQDPIQTFYSALIPALLIYHKLLTRFSLCQTYQNSLPGFVNS